ncbi:lysophospholipid acyltransferase family protein [Chloroflexota bacterium]
MNWFYYFARALTRMVFKIFCHFQINGRENVPDQGPVIVVANHLHWLDPPLLGIVIKRKMIFMAKEELFQSRISRYFIRSYGAFPVRRDGVDRKALREAEHVLEQGLALAIFPEGRRSENAQLIVAYSGAALMAVRSGAPILPVAIAGTEILNWRTLRKFPRWIPPVVVNIGTPFLVPKLDGKLTGEELSELTSSVMVRLAELLPAKYKGNYISDGNSERGN